MRSSGPLRCATVIPLAVALALLVAVPASARDTSSRRARPEGVSPAASATGPTIIGFELDATGEKTEPFTSRDNPTVHFVDTIGDNLSLRPASSNGNGQAIEVDDDDPSALRMLFDVPTRRLSILFGNDDPCCSDPGDRATLTVYRNGRVFAREHVTLNRNDLGDQTIEYRGRTAIDKARFVYDRAGAPIDLLEVVDDFQLAQVCTIRGSDRRNRRAGNAGPNGICGFNGADRIAGRRGNDALFGGGGRDGINGNAGNDLVSGGAGDDIIYTVDGVTGNDAVYGGPGNDVCTTDPDDVSISCEEVIVIAP